MPDCVLVGLYLFEKISTFQVFYYPFTAFKPIHSQVRAGQIIHYSVFVNHLDPLKMVGISYFKVIWIMCGRDFKRSGAEFHVYVFIEDDRDRLIENRQQDMRV